MKSKKYKKQQTIFLHEITTMREIEYKFLK